MPTIDEAIERAARASLETIMHDGDYLGDWLDCMDDHKLETAKLFIRAALSAFLADVPVSEAVVSAGGDVAFACSDINPDELRVAFKAMCAKLAEEIQ